MLWNFVLSSALLLQKFVIALGLGGLLPGEWLCRRGSPEGMSQACVQAPPAGCFARASSGLGGFSSMHRGMPRAALTATCLALPLAAQARRW